MKNDEDKPHQCKCNENGVTWPGDEPKAPAPGTTTTDPETGETIIVPLVR